VRVVSRATVMPLSVATSHPSMSLLEISTSSRVISKDLVVLSVLIKYFVFFFI